MGGLLHPIPPETERDTSRRTIFVAVGIVLLLALGAAVIFREKPRVPTAPPPYAANLKFSDIKLSQAQNFVGATVTYVDGTLTNSGSKTVTHVAARVTFKDLYSQVAQIEEVPIRVLRTSGPYPDTADLSITPLAPGQTQPFRLTFEHVSDQWNQGSPDLQVTGVTTK